MMSSDSAWRLGYERGILDRSKSVFGLWEHCGAFHCVHTVLRRFSLHLHQAAVGFEPVHHRHHFDAYPRDDL